MNSLSLLRTLAGLVGLVSSSNSERSLEHWDQPRGKRPQTAAMKRRRAASKRARAARREQRRLTRVRGL